MQRICRQVAWQHKQEKHGRCRTCGRPKDNADKRKECWDCAERSNARKRRAYRARRAKAKGRARSGKRQGKTQ